MIPLRWFAPLFGRVPLNSHVQQIVSACRERVWQQIEPRARGMNRAVLKGYTRVRAASVIRPMVHGHAAKFGMQAFESLLMNAVLEQLVTETLQRAAHARHSQTILRAA